MTILPRGLDLVDKICVVTGAGSGIGRAVALALAGEGARVALLERSVDLLEETADLIQIAGGIALPVLCDVSDETSVIAAHKLVQAHLGDAEVLVNNAAIIRHGTMDALTLTDWNMLLSVNLTGCFLCSQAFGKSMRERGSGNLVHISSVMANYPSPGGGAYSIAKAGLQMLSRLLAAEWGPSGVRSNTVNPALVMTPLSQHMYDRPGVTEKRSAAVPLRRIGTPDDIARAVLFLLSPLAEYVTGTEIHVDGGFQSNLMSLIPRPSPTEPR